MLERILDKWVFITKTSDGLRVRVVTMATRAITLWKMCRIITIAIMMTFRLTWTNLERKCDGNEDEQKLLNGFLST